MTRRNVLGAGVLTASVAATARFWVDESHAQAALGKYEKLFPQLDRFVEQFMRDMNSPGMTLVLADRDGVQRVATYGFGDLERQRKVQADELFHIGSITKSFIALALLQLHDEGKLDLNEPIADYLPWFRIRSSFAPITAHHLLTHSSGLPGAAEVFLSDPSQRHLAAYAPGRHFHYNNMAYVVLGHLAWTLDGRELPQIFRERIFEPLGMSKSEPVIDLGMREDTAKSYSPFLSDRPYPRYGRLCEAPAIVITSASGCIASTARDMGAYVQMIANRGRGPKQHLISPESFGLFSKRHIEAKDFGPTASYGYGIAVDEFEGNTMLRHTGGMVSFMSSMMIDIDEGIGGFASINAQQGYRPNPVVQHAVQLMRAQRSGKAYPAMPAADSPTNVKNAAEYAGVFQGGGRKLEFASEAEKLFLLREGKRVALEKLSGDDRFIAVDEDLGRFSLIFGRKAAKHEAPDSAATSPEGPQATDATDANGAVIEVSWGGDWYTNASYDGPLQFDHPKEWESHVGHYRNENPWIGSMRIVLLKGKLVLDGGTPLEADGDLFRLRSGPHSTEWIRFGEIVNGKCMRLKFSGEDLWRVAAP